MLNQIATGNPDAVRSFYSAREVKPNFCWKIVPTGGMPASQAENCQLGGKLTMSHFSGHCRQNRCWLMAPTSPLQHPDWWHIPNVSTRCHITNVPLLRPLQADLVLACDTYVTPTANQIWWNIRNFTSVRQPRAEKCSIGAGLTQSKLCQADS